MRKKSEKIKILHCIYDSVGNKWINGGGAYRTIEIYKRFPKNYNITILTGNYPGRKNKKIVGDNVNIKYMGIGLFYFISRFSYMYLARKYLRNNYFKYDLIIEDFTPYTPLKSYQYKNSICIIQNYFGFNLFKKFFIFGGILPYFRELKMISKFKNIIFSSNYIKNIILSKIKERKRFNYSVISYGINKQLFSNKIEDKRYILFLGRIEFYQKGLDVLLKVMKEISDIHLIIAGSGKDEKRLKSFIKKLTNVSFIGRVSGEKKIKILKEASFTVMPSRYESFGIVAVESSAAGTPVIGVKNTGLEETIVHKKTGILIERLSDELLKNAILFLWNNKKELKKYSQHAKEFAKRFDWNFLAKKQLEFYNKIILTQ